MEYCIHPFERLEIDVDGRCYCCCRQWNYAYCFGNIFEQSLEEIWNGEEAQKLRKSILDNCYTYCNKTECCPTYANSGEYTAIVKEGPKEIIFCFDNSTLTKYIFKNNIVERNSTRESNIWNSIIESKIIPFLKETKIISISLEEGILKNEYSKDVIKQITNKYPDIKFEIVSNGIFCSKRNLEELGIINQLKSIRVLIPSIQESTYNKIVKNGNINSVKDNLLYLSELKKQNLINDFKIDIMISSLNYREIPLNIKFANKIGAIIDFSMLQKKDFSDDLIHNYNFYNIASHKHPLFNNFIKVIANLNIKNHNNIYIDEKIKNLKKIKLYQQIINIKQFSIEYLRKILKDYIIFVNNKKKLKYVVIGAGSVGGTIAAFLKSAKKDVTIITKYPELIEAQKKQKGIRLISKVKGDHLYKIKMVDTEHIDNIQADVVFLCVRTPDFESTFDTIETISNHNTIVIPISNGFGIAQTLQDRLDNVNFIDASFVSMSRWFNKKEPIYEQKREYCELKFSITKNQDININLINKLEKDLIESGFTGGCINPAEMKTLLFERLITRSPFECCCINYDITANEINGDKEVYFKELCNELLILAKALKIFIREDFLEEYYENFESYKKRDDANVNSSILTDMKNNQNPEIYHFLFIVVDLAKSLNLYLPKYFELAEKFKNYRGIKIKEKLYCNNISSTISFHQKYTGCCTTLWDGPTFTSYQKSPKDIANEILNSRDKYINEFKNNIICPECNKCPWRNTTTNYNNKIKKIDLFYWYHCNCGCFYCAYINETNGKYSDEIKSGNPAILETIKKLYKENKVDRKNLVVSWGGGEITVLKEFPQVVKLFIKNGFNFMAMESSGIKYSPVVGKILRMNKGCITIAICAGCRETYKLIKRRDKYDAVISTFKKYVKDAKNNPDAVRSKYIILKNFNDNLEEVEKWLLISQEIGIKKVEISMEFCWGAKRKKGQEVEQYNYDIFDYVEKRCKELNLILIKNDTSLQLLKGGKY